MLATSCFQRSHRILYQRIKLPHLHVFQDQHGVALVQALAKELDNVLVMAELVQDIDFTAERLEDGGTVVCDQLLDCNLCGAMAQTLVNLQPDAWGEGTAAC